MEQVFSAASEWYRSLLFRKVHENGARQAVLHRRPVLATFCLSESGWEEFGKWLNTRHPYQTAAMLFMTGCNPRSLTILNSWGRKWDNDGSFNVESYTALELDKYPMKFYDVYRLESKLTSAEKQA
ncbi:uncharacterized protein TRIVIDRAFT_222054 [Trichoderma virens Gv29-8]|uniref:Peptidase C1A papain C-terminal domain-containing protein n=1 Tax=Hypocrea virens (strain Gv29-8 / FGSC 10586) TaxID=413071 RepID=G9MRR9_HYPVG|nr:uncharacterized protein TRIVIDRAFT_222054 [Trichoderma virens Gv29-8]EHK22788.1 hypothetical protein TRIVIDRAFT_222054 [Trichoderma virens Gv29-8]